MNKIFFLSLFVISVLSGAAVANAEEGPNYSTQIIGHENGKIIKQTVFYSYDRILTPQGYEPYVYSETADAIIIETMSGSVTLDKNTCGFSFHNKGYITQSALFSDSIIALNRIVTAEDWNEVLQVSAAACQASWNGEELTATKTAAGIGSISYKYIFDGAKWKTQLEATNLTSLTNRVFGFDQTIDLNRDTVFFAGGQKNLDNYDGQTFDRAWLENNEQNVVEFLNGYNYDFELGFDYLDSISVIDSGVNSSKLVFHYTHDDGILMPGETLIIDPTYGPSGVDSWNRVFTTAQAGASCSTTFSSLSDSATTSPIIRDSDNSDNCAVPYVQYDITSISDQSTIEDVDWATTVGTITGAVKNCDINHASLKPSTAAGQDLLDDMLDGDNTVLDNDTWCTTTGAKSLDLGTAADSYVEAQLPSDYAAFYVLYDDMTRDATSDHFFVGNYDTSTLTVTYSINKPDAVDDLSSPSQTYGGVDLLWTEPGLNTGTLSGYQINYTTPWGDPTTIITNNTGSSDTTATVSGLDIATPYSFRVSVWTEYGNNATGNILNITTTGNFTIGSAVFNQTNTQVLPITFEEQSVNSTAKLLNVTFANTYNMTCSFHFKFANTEQNYSNLDSYAVSTTLNETYFTFNNFENEIIDAYCYDEDSGTDADYLLRQTTFELLNQIDNFRNGTYGTDGKIGVYDGITLLVVIISMIGLNRVNESVGAVFNIMLLGSLAYFGIIELPTVAFGMLAVVLVFIVTSTRKV